MGKGRGRRGEKFFGWREGLVNRPEGSGGKEKVLGELVQKCSQKSEAKQESFL